MPGRDADAPWVMLEPITAMWWRNGLAIGSMEHPSSMPISSDSKELNMGMYSQAFVHRAVHVGHDGGVVVIAVFGYTYSGKDPFAVAHDVEIQSALQDRGSVFAVGFGAGGPAGADYRGCRCGTPQLSRCCSGRSG